MKQQAAERAALEGLKRIASTEWTTPNQPKMVLFFGDAMTNHASKTPKYGKRHGKAESAFFFRTEYLDLKSIVDQFKGRY